MSVHCVDVQLVCCECFQWISHFFVVEHAKFAVQVCEFCHFLFGLAVVCLAVPASSHFFRPDEGVAEKVRGQPSREHNAFLSCCCLLKIGR